MHTDNFARRSVALAFLVIVGMTAGMWIVTHRQTQRISELEERAQAAEKRQQDEVYFTVQRLRDIEERQKIQQKLVVGHAEKIRDLQKAQEQTTDRIEATEKTLEVTRRQLGVLRYDPTQHAYVR